MSSNNTEVANLNNELFCKNGLHETGMKTKCDCLGTNEYSCLPDSAFKNDMFSSCLSKMTQLRTASVGNF